jgi:transposase InsO family protein
VSGRRLVELFDDMARREVADIEERYRKWHARRHPRLLEILSWTQPGVVWAMDHAVPQEAVDGTYPAIFALRDLSSGYQILWEPVEDAGAERVISWLQWCFERLGAPLVLKSDSGPAFIAHVLEEFLHERGVKHILSPPRRPQYNGSVEASIRWMKVRTELEAEAAGHGGAWRREDMDRARLRANTAERRRKGRAEERWLARGSIGDGLRAAFDATVAREEQAALLERGLPPPKCLPVLLRRAVSRDAIRRALVAHDLLHFKRRRDPQPIKHTIVDKCG